MPTTSEPQPQPHWPSPRLVYHPAYNISLLGLTRLHPFDVRKYGRAWNLLRSRFGKQINDISFKPSRPATDAELELVHLPAYLSRLRDPGFVAQVVEVPIVRRLPRLIVDRKILLPMRWATAGTILAAAKAKEHGLCFNLGGGYHHARAENGHGFCAYADIGLAIAALRKTGQLRPDDRVVYVDLDAHQGDGVCHTFFDDSHVFIYDQYNALNFPFDQRAQHRIDCAVPLAPTCRDVDYLGALRSKLPRFLDAISRTNAVKLAIYNAGTDIYTGDRLGNLAVSTAAVLERDQFVLEELMRRQLPTVVLTSGGYSRESYRMIADMITFALRR